MRILFSPGWRILFWPLSLVMHLVSRCRNFCYQYGIFKSSSVSACTISVGNISVGGTGKTPTIIALAEFFHSKGKRVAVISRGYGRKSKGLFVVSDGKKIMCDIDQAGDEPFLIAQQATGVSVIVAEDRIIGARHAINVFHSEIILLDDAFQHRRMRRDIDIVLIDTKRLKNNASLLPAGPYREGIRQLNRAHFTLLVSRDGKVPSDINAVMKKLRNITEGSIGNADISPKWLWFPKENNRESLSIFLNKKVIIVSGIGQPHILKQFVHNQGAQILESFDFEDHHDYCTEDVRVITDKANQCKADFIITTAKDWVKLHDKLHPSMPVAIPELSVMFPENFEMELWNKITAIDFNKKIKDT